MKRYVAAVVGFCAISAAYITATLLVPFVLVMSHCALSDAQIDAGEACTQPADLFFRPIVIAAVIGYVWLQWMFLRWALRKRPRDNRQ